MHADEVLNSREREDNVFLLVLHATSWCVAREWGCSVRRVRCVVVFVFSLVRMRRLLV